MLRASAGNSGVAVEQGHFFFGRLGCWGDLGGRRGLGGQHRGGSRGPPGYLAQDFATQTPNAYLMRVAPLEGVKLAIEACQPPPWVGEMLGMPPGEPCLVLRRQTQYMGRVASVAAMWHPASRYQFTGSF